MKTREQMTNKELALVKELDAMVLINTEEPRLKIRDLFENKKKKLTRFIIERKFLGQKNTLCKKTGMRVLIDQYKDVRIIAEFENGNKLIVSNTVFNYYKDGIELEYKNVR